jgi:hypothetical protein
MKQALVVFCTLLGAALAAHGQPFTKGINVLSGGIGLGSSLGGFTSSSQTPAFSAHYERAMWDAPGPGMVSLGGYIGFKSFKYSNQYAVLTSRFTYNQKWSYTVVGVRSAYHYNGLKSDEFDVYSGLMLSYNILNYTYEDSNPSGVRFDNTGYGSGMGFSWYAGGRYFFARNIAAFTELGFGVAYLTIGLAFTF